MSDSKEGSWEAKLGMLLGGFTSFVLIVGMGVFGIGLIWALFRVPQPELQAAVEPSVSAVATPAPASSGAPADGAAPAPEPAVAADPEFDKLMTVGQQTYAVCLACHGPAGVAVAANLAPNLVDSAVVNGPDEPLAMILLNGIQPEGRYAGAMIGWKAQFSDEQIAGVLTYIRNSFGNASPKISPDFIGEMRAKYADQAAAFTRDQIDAASGS